MNWTTRDQKACHSLISELHLPESFEEIVRDIYVPLSEVIISKKQDGPLLVSINGAQGTGKSTLTAFLKHFIESRLGGVAVELSLDDFYFTKNERHSLSQDIHPLLITRGVPGTHDIDLLENVLDSLMNSQACRSPKFNKAMDDRNDESEWVCHGDPVQAILFEGWCNNSPAQTDSELADPINELEAEEDADCIWRKYANDMLIEYHRRIFNRADVSVMLNAQGFDRVYEWRALQERKLDMNTDSKTGKEIMDEKELRRFIQHYERITKHTLSSLPARADIVLPVAEDHSITGIIRNDK